jgi:hypothetical protein
MQAMLAEQIRTEEPELPIGIVRIDGVVQWVCPECRGINRTRVMSSYFDVSCASCAEAFCFSLVLIPAPKRRLSNAEKRARTHPRPLDATLSRLTRG